VREQLKEKLAMKWAGLFAFLGLLAIAIKAVQILL
jgi:hypothetical protein